MGALITYTLAELIRLDEVDFDQLEVLAGDEEAARAWWARRRAEWAREDEASERKQAGGE